MGPAVDVVDVMEYRLGVHRHQVQGGMTHAALGRNLLRDASHFFCVAAQEQGFQAVVVVQMDVHGGHHQVVGVVLQIGEPLRQPALKVVGPWSEFPAIAFPAILPIGARVGNDGA